MKFLEFQRGIVLVGTLATLGLASWFYSAGLEEHADSAVRPVEVSRRTQADLGAGVAAQPRYVGTAACVDCHQEQTDKYRGSHHQRAIENPAPASVLAPFKGETFAHDGTKSKFFKRGSDYLVRTQGEGGVEREFVVAHSFGVFPLQQYLLDVGGGKLQTFTVAWDSRSKAQGGQRYFDLYPDEKLGVEHELHWTRPSQNWNFACADCHTTALHRGYDETNGTFGPSYADLSVGCEACHGPGSRHVSWAQSVSSRKDSTVSDGAPDSSKATKGLLIALRRATAWTIVEGARVASPRSIGENQQEVEACAPCHSRRQQLREGRTVDEPFLDAYVPELLAAGHYHADGQIRDEVYVYGSFLQSRMFQGGVRCSDCHDPHSLQLRRQGNDLCGGCHSAEIYDSAAHHHHPGSRSKAWRIPPGQVAGSTATSDGTQCVDCHMPTTTYMQVDPRHDHSLRIPRPALSAQVGAPDACTGCHERETQAWAAARVAEWFGADRAVHYGLVFQAARKREPRAGAQLIELSRMAHQPAIVRATALQLLANYPDGDASAALEAHSGSQDALIRLGVTQGALGLDAQKRFDLLQPLLSDPVLAVRVEATRALVGIPKEAIPVSQRATYGRALNELWKVEKFYADRPEAWLRIALLEVGRGAPDKARAALEKALDLDERFVPALVNLADLHRSTGNEEEARALLQRAVGLDERNAEAWHAWGLSLVRDKKQAEALPLLRRAAALRPENPRMAYVYAVALADGGDVAGAIDVLKQALGHHAHDRSLLQVLMGYARQVGDEGLAREAALRLAALEEHVLELRR